MSIYIWTGASGVDWRFAGDWSPGGGPPGIADLAIVEAGGTVSISQAESIDGLSLASGAEVLLSAAPFSVAGSIDNAGLIVADGTLVVAGSAITLDGVGVLALGDSAMITAQATGDMLVNLAETITGSGTLGAGGLAVTNDAAGVIEDVAFANGVTNSGTISGATLTGLVDQTGGGMVVGGTTSAGTTIDGGTFDGVALPAFGTVTLDGTSVPVTDQGIGSGGVANAVVLLGSIDNTGTMSTTGITMDGEPIGQGTQFIVGSPTVDLGGGGQVDFSGYFGTTGGFVGDEPYALGAIAAAVTGDVLVNLDNTIAGAEGIGGGGLVLDNTAGGTIDATGGIMTLDPLSLANAGLMEAQDGTLDVIAGTTATNTGTMFGNGGLVVTGAALDNAGGTIAANGGLLVFQGALTGGNLAVDTDATLELSSNWFGGGAPIPVSFATGNDLLQIDVTDTAGAFSAVGSLAVSGFVAGDTILVQGTLAGGSFPGFTSVTNAGPSLGFVAGGETLGTLGFAGGTSHLVLGQDGNHDEIITIACFAAGTRILTTAGEVPVDALQIGDRLPTLRGRIGTVRWLGHRRIDCRHHPRPIRVRAGAFAPGAPARDLLLSPDHAVYLDNALIPVRFLVNGASIAPVETDSVTYWHVELDRHDIVLAEGAPAESYLDTGNRCGFNKGKEEEVFFLERKNQRTLSTGTRVLNR